jgi:hypothetical protein
MKLRMLAAFFVIVVPLQSSMDRALSSGCAGSVGPDSPEVAPCEGNLDFELSFIGWSNPGCDGCTVLYSWEIRDSDTSEEIDSGAGTDKPRCGSSSVRHTVLCPSSGQPWMVFGSACSSC